MLTCMQTYTTLKKRLLAGNAVRSHYDKLKPEYMLVRALIRLRLQQGLSQSALAAKIGTKQSAVSRLESGQYNPSVAFLRSVAHALDSELHISLTKK